MLLFWASSQVGHLKSCHAMPNFRANMLFSLGHGNPETGPEALSRWCHGPRASHYWLIADCHQVHRRHLPSTCRLWTHWKLNVGAACSFHAICIVTQGQAYSRNTQPLMGYCSSPLASIWNMAGSRTSLWTARSSWEPVTLLAFPSKQGNEAENSCELVGSHVVGELARESDMFQIGL